MPSAWDRYLRHAELFFLGFWDGKIQFCKGNLPFRESKNSKMSPAASLWELEIPKKVLMFFEGSIFRLWEREMPQKVLMGKVLAVDPYTLGGGG